MPKSEHKITAEIKEYIVKSGEHLNSWYVGISKDARNRLFVEHGVKEKGSWWIIRQAATSEIAREVEAYFVNTLRTDGGTGGGDEESDQVYAYLKRSNTEP